MRVGSRWVVVVGRDGVQYDRERMKVERQTRSHGSHGEQSHPLRLSGIPLQRLLDGCASVGGVHVNDADAEGAVDAEEQQCQ